MNISIWTRFSFKAWSTCAPGGFQCKQILVQNVEVNVRREQKWHEVLGKSDSHSCGCMSASRQSDVLRETLHGNKPSYWGTETRSARWWSTIKPFKGVHCSLKWGHERVVLSTEAEPSALKCFHPSEHTSSPPRFTLPDFTRYFSTPAFKISNCSP